MDNKTTDKEGKTVFPNISQKLKCSASKKLKIELPYDPAIPLLGIYPKKMKTPIQKDTCTLTFIAALLTVAKIRSNLSVHQQMNG